jgi:hypothetical protein
MRRAAFLAALATATVGAPPAIASQLDVAVGPPDARFGEAHVASGQMTDDAGKPLEGRRISLEVRPFPFTGEFRPLDHATTDAQGRFRFRGIELDRNYDIRVVAFDGTTSGIARAFTYPATRLRFKALHKGRRIRFVQTYAVPRDVTLTARTLFYVGRASASRAPVRARGRTVRTSRGHFRSAAVVTLPRSWHGRFHYASCFTYSRGSGMGDPARGCPRRYRF